MALYPYQERVKGLIRSGKSVILQAPTGAGKTRAALAPYIESFFDAPPEAFPRKCVYSVPMRVLANQFVQEYKSLASSYKRKFQKEMRVKIQTGEHPDDARFCGDLIFATIDQSLSSALGFPYSLSSGLANLNAGAFYSSYLVFDEFHLFPIADESGANGALTTTLQLLMRLKGIVPFVLMTATFSSTMLGELARLLEAEVVQVSLEEYRMIATGEADQARSRRYFVHDRVLDAKTILDQHQTRSIVICNQVKRSQSLFDELLEATKASDTQVILLHSRFTDEDRKRKEKMIREQFNKERNLRTIRSLILVSTQVIEVGVDITSERLYTEIAPANAIFQRAGRCARYPGEQGQVHIYCVPNRQSRRTQASAEEETPHKPDYLPYMAALCEQSWQSFCQRHGQTLDFQAEQQVIDEVHTDSDRLLLEAMQRQTAMLWDDIQGALHRGEREMRSRLIRRVDNITVFAAATPDAIGNPFTAQGFGLWRGTVKGLLEDLKELSQGWMPEEGASDWLMQFPTTIEKNAEDPTQPIQIDWREVNHASFLDMATMVVINHAFCAYNFERGFRIVLPESGGYASPPGEFKRRNSQGGFRYKLESYRDHISNMLAIYRRDFIDDYCYIQQRLAKSWNLPADALDRGIRLAIALHDVAKMDHRWQRWVRLYQKAIDDAIVDSTYMAVHTNWNPKEPAHQSARQQADRQVKRPPHAGESAIAVGRIVGELAGDNRLICAVLSAIARHHSPMTQAFDSYQLDPAAKQAVLSALQVATLPTPTRELMMKSPNAKLEDYLIQQGESHFDQLLLYLWIVRMLRMCDGLSQEE